MSVPSLFRAHTGSPVGSDNGDGGCGDGGGSVYDSDNSRTSDRPRITDAHFGIKRLMDDLGWKHIVHYII